MSKQTIELKVDRETFAPKYCTNFSVGLLDNGKITLTGAYSEGETVLICERLITDKEAAANLYYILGEILEG
jgi:hypothetical protein